MKTNRHALINCIIVTSLFVLLCLANFLLPKSTYSDSERRNLATMPELSLQTVAKGTFMNKFEDYATDHFPFREPFRSLKAMTSYYALLQPDNNGIYIHNGYLSDNDYPLNVASIKRATDKFANIYNIYLKDADTNVYFSIIPDKNYFLSQDAGQPTLDYTSLVSTFEEGASYGKYIDIFDLLAIEDYYKTDTHWKQENIIDVAEKLGKEMNHPIVTDYETNTLDNPFYGVYYGQAALPLNPDTLQYLTNDAIDSFVVYNYETQANSSVYDMDKAFGKDPYEMFLSGSISLLTIENPNADNEDSLIIFRDSFGSSIAPLLATGYKKVTLIDIRYITPAYVAQFVDYENSDVLFLYSTLVLNNSETLK